jgi:hypothetical protein
MSTWTNTSHLCIEPNTSTQQVLFQIKTAENYVRTCLGENTRAAKVSASIGVVPDVMKLCTAPNTPITGLPIYPTEAYTAYVDVIRIEWETA